ncbi:programmed cell death protein 2-like protein [Sarcoptes scabiei]|uniref:Programmed cell death protein 2-like protein n=1 Tax=Sarcoptes scabiei TaxID=52283 RepID=A0A131ZT65_SARSC|nr:programmed cell death protein 2-like protein [Sarcoptes scabiei]
MIDPNLDLGLVRPFAHRWQSKCKYFPSKIGGRPSFLVLNPILDLDRIKCSKCSKPMRFLLQIYAPLENLEHAFHRTVYVFGCGQSSKCSNEFKVFRCQLPQQNEFYSDRPPNYEKDLDDYDPSPIEFGRNLCSVCGIDAKSFCSKCRQSWYCCREHQLAHWKKGGHKQNCSNEKVDNLQEDNIISDIVFKELEIVIRTPDDDDETKSDDGDDDEQSNAILEESEMKKFNEYIETKKPEFQDENLDEIVKNNKHSEEDLEDDVQQQAEQECFDRFKRATRRGEILRYYSDWNLDDQRSKILWISSRPVPREIFSKVPRCPNCFSERRFEFQIIPTLLNKILHEYPMDHLDIGTLIIFSCPDSCQPTKSNKYFEEYIYNQPLFEINEVK